MGAFDPLALEAVAALCGVIPTTVLETAARIRLMTARGTLVVVGPGTTVHHSGRTVSAPCRLQVEGEVVVEPSGRSLVATPNGWSTSLPFGAANCQSVRSGDELLAFSTLNLSDLRLDPSPFTPRPILRIIGEAPSGPWVVQNDSDRRGVRLRSESCLSGPPGLPVSRPCFLGTCQVTPNGTLIVHGPDGPTLGGYHQAGVVARVDLPTVANLRAGDSVMVEGISVEESLELRRNQREEIEKWRRWIDLTL
jgi:hypothetical protein